MLKRLSFCSAMMKPDLKKTYQGHLVTRTLTSLTFPSKIGKPDFLSYGATFNNILKLKYKTAFTCKYETPNRGGSGGKDKKIYI